MNSRENINGQSHPYKIDPADYATIAYICKQNERPQDLAATRSKQIAHLRRVFEHRGGDLPATDDGRKHLLALLRVMAAIPKVKTTTLSKEAKSWAPSWTEAERNELVHRAMRTPRVHRNTTLGLTIGLVDAQREACKAWSIWPIDLSLAEAKLRKKARSKEQRREKRRAAGARPQSESISATKPWLAEGKSRTAWYEERKRAREAQPDNFGAGIKEEESDAGAKTVRPNKPNIDRRAPQRDGATDRRWWLEDDLPDGVGYEPPPDRQTEPVDMRRWQ